MSMITLYGTPVSAFTAKVRIVLDLKGIQYTEVPPPGGFDSEMYRAIVPAGTVPGLSEANIGLSDSNAIMEYLDETRPQPPLMPADAPTRAQVRKLLGYHDLKLDAVIHALINILRFEPEAPSSRVIQKVESIETVLKRLNSFISPDPYALGSQMTLADCAYPVTVQMALMIASELGEPMELPHALGHWLERLARVPAVARSLKMHRDATEDWLEEICDTATPQKPKKPPAPIQRRPQPSNGMMDFSHLHLQPGND